MVLVRWFMVAVLYFTVTPTVDTVDTVVQHSLVVCVTRTREMPAMLQSQTEHTHPSRKDSVHTTTAICFLCRGFAQAGMGYKLDSVSAN